MTSSDTHQSEGLQSRAHSADAGGACLMKASTWACVTATAAAGVEAAPGAAVVYNSGSGGLVKMSGTTSAETSVTMQFAGSTYWLQWKLWHELLSGMTSVHNGTKGMRSSHSDATKAPLATSTDRSSTRPVCLSYNTHPFTMQLT